ncbi:uncharacterized protein METZ01_LOCUS239962, partial [marine metagenome]
WSARSNRKRCSSDTRWTISGTGFLITDPQSQWSDDM